LPLFGFEADSIITISSSSFDNLTAGFALSPEPFNLSYLPWSLIPEHYLND
jgi:hypothetical protein